MEPWQEIAVYGNDWSLETSKAKTILVEYSLSFHPSVVMSVVGTEKYLTLVYSFLHANGPVVHGAELASAASALNQASVSNLPVTLPQLAWVLIRSRGSQPSVSSQLTVNADVDRGVKICAQCLRQPTSKTKQDAHVKQTSMKRNIDMINAG